jgi:hypothetical protein
MANRRITDLTESTALTSSYYMTVYDPNEVADIQPDGYVDYNKKIALKNFANLPSQSALTWYGTSADGDLVTTASVNFTTTNDQEVLVKNYRNLTISTGHTVTVSNRCKGLLIYIGGDCVINGTLTMTGKGAKATGSVAHYVYQAKGYMGSYIPMFFFPNGAPTGYIPIYPGNEFPSDTGFGGTGFSGSGGSYGTSWSGGAGGGAGASATGGSSYGGAGGNAVTTNYGGGAGNPGGTSGGGTGGSGGTGTGGFIMLVVKGSLTIGSTGTISANGVAGGTGTAGGGGGSGGGRVIILYTKSFTNNGSITVNGGAGGGTAPSTGSAGGSGTITLREVSVF